MNIINDAIMYFLSFKTYVVLPVIIFTLAMIFRIRFETAVKSALTIGIGFVGIFMTFDYFIKIVTPVVKALIVRSGLALDILDVGWPPLAAMTWSFKLAPLLLLLFLAINMVMLVFRLTRTVNIDIWNYWHVLLCAAMIHFATGSVIKTVILSSLSFIIVLKMAEWSAPAVNKLSGLDGICIPHLSALAHLPIALILDKLIDRIPVLNKIDAKPEKIQQKIGLFGEPMIIGLIIGVLLGIGAGYDIKQVTDLGVGFAAVIYILPKMGGILGSSLIPISEGMKEFIGKHFKNIGATYIGLDVAVLFGVPAVIVTALLLIPTQIALAFVLPGVRFIPLGDLTNILVPIAIVCAATKGNVVRSYLIGIPVVILNLYVATAMAPFFTQMATKSGYKIPGYDGIFTSYLDGGHYIRAMMVRIASSPWEALIYLPIILLLVLSVWKLSDRSTSTEQS